MRSRTGSTARPRADAGGDHQRPPGRSGGRFRGQRRRPRLAPRARPPAGQERNFSGLRTVLDRDYRREESDLSTPIPARRSGRNRFLAAGLLALAGTLLLALPGAVQAKPRKHKPQSEKVTVMTRNLYLGADLGPAIGATSFDDFIDKNGQILRDVDTNNFPVRARGLAKEILKQEARPGRPAGGLAVAHRRGQPRRLAGGRLPQGEGRRHTLHGDHGQVRLPEAAAQPAQQGQEALPGGQGAEGVRLRGAGRLRRRPEHGTSGSDAARSTAG